MAKEEKTIKLDKLADGMRLFPPQEFSYSYVIRAILPELRKDKEKCHSHYHFLDYLEEIHRDKSILINPPK